MAAQPWRTPHRLESTPSRHTHEIQGRHTMPVAFTPAKVIEAVRKAPGTRVKVAVSDIDGILRGKYMHKDKFASAAEGGFGFCDVVFGWDSQDVCYDNTKIIG